jgi:hypothetical protein
MDKFDVFKEHVVMRYCRHTHTHVHTPGIGAIGLVAPRPDTEESVKDFIERHLGSAVSLVPKVYIS